MAETETKKTKQARRLRSVRVGILTPYLSESLEQMISVAPSLEWAVSQVVKFGYNPMDSLSGTEVIETNRRRVEILTPGQYEGPGFGMTDSQYILCLDDPRLDLAIAGAVESTEDLVVTRKNSGLVVARYSVFYGEKSRYTGREASEAGYALDIPKDVPTVRALLSSESFLASLLSRDERKVTKSIENLNTKLERPIIVTPFLQEALNVSRRRAK
jgi:hypothetical protein